MYRPDRIGPYGLASVESNPIEITGAELVAADGGFNPPNCLTRGAVANKATKVLTLRQTSTWALAQNVGLCIGAKIIGDEQMPEGKYLLDYHGTMLVTVPTGNNVLGAIGLIGRADNNGVEEFTMSKYSVVPVIIQAQDTQVHLHMQGTRVIGDFVPDGVISTDEIFAGIFIYNLAASKAIENMLCSFSVHRYESDINTFDPNR